MRARTAKTKAAPKPGRLPKGSTADSIYEQLRADILELRLAPGALLDENEISQRFGVSRSPVREAVIRLVAESLAESVRNRGAVVATFDLETLPAWYDAVAVVYRLNARLAALRGGEAAAAELEAVQMRLDAAIAASDAFGVIRENRAFHDMLAKIGGNPWFRRWQNAVLDQGQRIMRLHVRQHGETVPLDQLDEHRAIIAAVRERDAAKAEAAGARDARITRNEAMRFIGASTVETVDL